MALSKDNSKSDTKSKRRFGNEKTRKFPSGMTKQKSNSNAPDAGGVPSSGRGIIAATRGTSLKRMIDGMSRGDPDEI
jgi:hypothetical protein